MNTELGLPLRFWAKVAKGAEPDGCWEWTGCLSNGYGRFGLRATATRAARTEYAHRLALEARLGRPLESGKEAMHACDNPRCVRPEHLSEGSGKENIQDCIAKGRFKFPKAPDNSGQSHGMSKLSEEQARWAYASPLSQKEIARILVVNQSVISRIKGGKAWKHVAAASEATNVP